MALVHFLPLGMTRGSMDWFRVHANLHDAGQDKRHDEAVAEAERWLADVLLVPYQQKWLRRWLAAMTEPDDTLTLTIHTFKDPR